MSAGSRKHLRPLIALLAFVLALGAVEVGARVAFRVRHHRLSPPNFPWMEITARGPRLVRNTHAEIFARINGRSVWLDVNSLGFRGPELDPKKSRPRLLLLGDSVMFGPGLLERETIPGRLRELIPGAEIINAAVPGLGTKEEVDLLDETWNKVRPDVVALGFYANDPHRSVILEEQYGNLPDWISGPITRLRRHSVAFNELWSRALAAALVRSGTLNAEWVELYNGQAWIRDRTTYDQIVRLAADDFGAAWHDDAWPGIEAELRRMSSLCVERGAKAAVVVFPVALQVGSEVGDTLPQERVAAIGRKLGIPALDPLPALRAHKTERLFYDQCHLTPLGAEVVAQELARFLRGERLVP